MDYILKTTNLCKSFKKQLAVNEVSLNIPRIAWAEWCGKIYYLKNAYWHYEADIWNNYI